MQRRGWTLVGYNRSLEERFLWHHRLASVSLISLLSSLVGWSHTRPGALQLNLTVNAERARGRQEIGSRLWGEETTNKNLVIAFGSFLIIQPGNSMTFWLGMWPDVTTCEHLLLPKKIIIKIRSVLALFSWGQISIPACYCWMFRQKLPLKRLSDLLLKSETENFLILKGTDWTINLLQF